MPSINLSVEERISLLKNVFNDFGIPVAENSLLDQSIKSEFGRGKRSVLNQILNNLTQETEAVRLAICIGTALEKNAESIDVKKIGKVLHERIPSALQILDTTQQIEKRIDLLTQLFQHFENKITEAHLDLPHDQQSAKLLRMLAATREQLRANCEIHAAGMVAEHVGIIVGQKELSRAAQVLKIVTPALISLEHKDTPLEQKINQCINAIAALGRAFSEPKVLKIAEVLDTLHNLLRVNLPALPEKYTVDQVLRNLDLHLGDSTIQALHARALKLGLTETEVIQIIYHHKSARELTNADQTLLTATYENKQHAASCGLLAKLGQDIKCKELERLGLAGLCLISLRQTYFEIKTHSLTPTNFSESLGLILSSVGIITKSKMLYDIGGGIIEGVKTYNATKNLPGGPYVAVPLAIYSVLNKVFLADKNVIQNATVPITPEIQLQVLFQQMLNIQKDYRQLLTQMHSLLQKQQLELLGFIERGFTNLHYQLQHSHIKNIQFMYSLTSKIDDLHNSMNKEFQDIYLEHVYEPVQEIQFYMRYEQDDFVKLKIHKQKLNMWLLFKSKSHKINGYNIELDKQVKMLINENADASGFLAAINKFINSEFGQSFPENLPHLPSWIIAARSYIQLMQKSWKNIAVDNEVLIIDDIIVVGQQLQAYLSQLSAEKPLWSRIATKIEQASDYAQAIVQNLLNKNRFNPLLNLTQINQQFAAQMPNATIMAENAPDSEQLEKFDAISLDVSNLWDLHFKPRLPQELLLADAYNLGKFQVTFGIDPAVNHFANVREIYSTNSLCDQARFVLFKINLFFILNESSTPFLLNTAWFAYDLQNSAQRFEEYYNLKFKYGLRHKRYLWIALDGMRNQVEGHGETETHKLIDYARLATIYQNWWSQAQPVNVPSIATRLFNHAPFMSATGQMLINGSFMQAQEHNILALQLQLKIKLQQHIFSQRCSFVIEIQEHLEFKQRLQKLDLYTGLWYALQSIFILNLKQSTKIQLVQELLAKISSSANIENDYSIELQDLFKLAQNHIQGVDYKQSSLYQSIETILLDLELLQINASLPHSVGYRLIL